MIDARYEMARVDGQVVDVAVLAAVGLDADGYRQVLGVEAVYGEAEQTWYKFPGGLRDRGLSGVRLVISEGQAGLGRARREHLPGVPWQHCQRHFLQNALERAPAQLEDELQERLRAVWDGSEVLEEARGAGLGTLATDLAEDEGLEELAERLEMEGEDTLSCFHFPSTHRLRTLTTDGMERLNQKVRGRSRVVRIVPNPERCRRLVCARLKEHHEDGIIERRYCRMDDYFRWNGQQQVADSKIQAAV